MSYPYVGKVAASVGNGLGGLPVRVKLTAKVISPSFYRATSGTSVDVLPPLTASFMRVTVVGKGGDAYSTIAGGAGGGGGCSSSGIVSPAKVNFTINASQSVAIIGTTTLTATAGQNGYIGGNAAGGTGTGGKINTTGGLGGFTNSNYTGGGGAAGLAGDGGNGSNTNNTVGSQGSSDGINPTGGSGGSSSNMHGSGGSGINCSGSVAFSNGAYIYQSINSTNPIWGQVGNTGSSFQGGNGGEGGGGGGIGGSGGLGGSGLIVIEYW